jgi:hypothetical protein
VKIRAWLSIALTLAAPAVAKAELSCAEWKRMSPDQKAAAVQGIRG